MSAKVKTWLPFKDDIKPWMAESKRLPRSFTGDAKENPKVKVVARLNSRIKFECYYQGGSLVGWLTASTVTKLDIDERMELKLNLGTNLISGSPARIIEFLLENVAYSLDRQSIISKVLWKVSCDRVAEVSEMVSEDESRWKR